MMGIENVKLMDAGVVKLPEGLSGNPAEAEAAVKDAATKAFPRRRLRFNSSEGRLIINASTLFVEEFITAEFDGEYVVFREGGIRNFSSGANGVAKIISILKHYEKA